MNRKLLMLACGICILIAAGALARDMDGVTIRPVESPVIQHYGAGVAGPVVGNLNAPYYSIGGWFEGNEEYKYLFDPTMYLDCLEGFQLLMVHMLVDFDTTMVPVTFEAWVDLEDAFYDPLRDCWLPGEEDCRSEPALIEITQPGLWNIGLPIFCDCAYMLDPWRLPYMYMLSMHFIGNFRMNLVLDEFPTPCTNYNNWGDGWFDLYGEFGDLGNIIMFGDVACCDDPVAERGKTWSDIKSLYR